MKQPFAIWDDRYSIGIKIVDDQHKELFAIANDLYDACQGANAVTTEHFKEVLQKAVNYVALHFSTEERIMKKTNDPEFEMHQTEHDMFVKKVMEEAAGLNHGDEDAPELFMTFLRNWISDHVTGTDIKIGQHVEDLRKKGLLKEDMIL